MHYTPTLLLLAAVAASSASALSSTYIRRGEYGPSLANDHHITSFHQNSQRDLLIDELAKRWLADVAFDMVKRDDSSSFHPLRRRMVEMPPVEPRVLNEGAELRKRIVIGGGYKNAGETEWHSWGQFTPPDEDPSYVQDPAPAEKSVPTLPPDVSVAPDKVAQYRNQATLERRLAPTPTTASDTQSDVDTADPTATPAKGLAHFLAMGGPGPVIGGGYKLPGETTWHTLDFRHPTATSTPSSTETAATSTEATSTPSFTPTPASVRSGALPTPIALYRKDVDFRL
ncbi:hypothetical protein K474DRAFT_1700675 [Panus rudis PR-1116 ss-1]|nr:hypothetical protein K474DRAFT_1700675 [Panus rudis PR-1116 ss-1]